MPLTVFYTSFAGTSSVVMTRAMEMSQNSAYKSIGAAVATGYSTASVRVIGREGSRRQIITTLSHGRVSAIYDFADIYCGSTPPDFP